MKREEAAEFERRLQERADKSSEVDPRIVLSAAGARRYTDKEVDALATQLCADLSPIVDIERFVPGRLILTLLEDRQVIEALKSELRPSGDIGWLKDGDHGDHADRSSEGGEE